MTPETEGPNHEVPATTPPYADALREARAGQSRSLEDMARLTGIRVGYLEALERGELDRTLSSGYVRQMVVRYAACLGLDPENVLKSYEGADPSQPPPFGGLSLYDTVPSTRRPRTSRVVLGAAALVLLGLAVWAALQGDWLPGLRPDTVRVSDTQGAGPVVSTVAIANSTSTTRRATTTTVTAAAQFGEDTTTTTSAAAIAFQTRLTATEDVWLGLTEEESGEVLYEGILAQGDELELEPAGTVRVVVGKPDAVTVVVNGHTADNPAVTRWLLSADGVTGR